MHDLLIAARHIRRDKGKVLLSHAGKRMINDYGALQAELFDTYFTTFDHFTFERFPIEYHEKDYVPFSRYRSKSPCGLDPSDGTGWMVPAAGLGCALAFQSSGGRQLLSVCRSARKN